MHEERRPEASEDGVPANGVRFGLLYHKASLPPLEVSCSILILIFRFWSIARRLVEERLKRQVITGDYW